MVSCEVFIGHTFVLIYHGVKLADYEPYKLRRVNGCYIVVNIVLNA